MVNSYYLTLQIQVHQQSRLAKYQKTLAHSRSYHRHFQSRFSALICFKSFAAVSHPSLSRGSTRLLDRIDPRFYSATMRPNRCRSNHSALDMRPFGIDEKRNQDALRRIAVGLLQESIKPQRRGDVDFGVYTILELYGIYADRRLVHYKLASIFHPSPWQCVVIDEGNEGSRDL